jgi:predicted nucleic-acid-binding protein
VYCLDANVLLRCITQDDKTLSPRALAFLKKALASHEGIYLPDVVVTETVWVLQKFYQFKRSDICDALEPLLLHAKVRSDHLSRIQRALSLYQNQSISIVDAYLAAIPAEDPANRLVTFDRQLRSLSPQFIEP